MERTLPGLANVEQKETKFGERLMWTFWVSRREHRGRRLYQHESFHESQGLSVGSGLSVGG